MKTLGQKIGRSGRGVHQRRAASRMHTPSRNDLTRPEPGEFRAALLQKHAELLQDAARMRNEPCQLEVGSHLYQHTQQLLAEVEDALRRIEDGSYGVCEGAQHRIGRARLRAIPWARRCLECAMKRDRWP